MTNKIPHVVIIGGGFGGLSAANRLRESFSQKQAKITIIDKKDWFMVGFVKIWIIQGKRKFEDSTGSLHKLKQKDIEFINDEVTSIDPKNNSVKTKSKTIPFDFLIIASGAELKPEKIPGLMEYGFNLYDPSNLESIRNSLLNLKKGKIAILITSFPYKCPPAPFEAGMLIGEMISKENKDNIKIDIYSPAPITLPAAGPKVSQEILNLINSKGIQFHNYCKTLEIKEKKIIFEKEQAEYDVLLVIPPHQAPIVIFNSGLITEGDFISIGRDCKTKFENIFAIGDVTSMRINNNYNVPKAGIFAEEEGLIVADKIISIIRNSNNNSLFIGKGACFMESGDQKASQLRVDLFSTSEPQIELTLPSYSNLQEKIEFEKERLEKWF